MKEGMLETVKLSKEAKDKKLNQQGNQISARIDEKLGAPRIINPDCHLERPLGAVINVTLLS